jgi:hypothetical protein
MWKLAKGCVWIFSWIYSPLISVIIINSISLAISPTLKYTTVHASSSQRPVLLTVLWEHFPMADVLFPLWSEAVRLSQAQAFSAVSHPTTAFSRRPAHTESMPFMESVSSQLLSSKLSHLRPPGTDRQKSAFLFFHCCKRDFCSG